MSAGIAATVGAGVRTAARSLAAQHAERVGQLDQRRSAGLRNEVERPFGLVRIRTHHERTGLGLHHHDGDRVRERR